MAKFRINILGCGSATPTPRHNPSSQVIDFRDNLFMIDCGEGAQSMMRRMRLKFARLNHIFISHMHGDHCLGLPGLLSTLALHERTGCVTIHLPADGLEIMRSITDYFCRESPFEIKFNPITGSGGTIFESDSLTIEAFPLYHRIPCYGYIFREKPKLRHLIGDMVRYHQIPLSALHGIKEGKNYITPDGTVIPNHILTTPADPSMSYAYCSDTTFNRAVAKAVTGVDTIYHEATYDSSFESKAYQRGHSTAAQAATIAAEAHANRLIIGHYSKRYTDVEILLREAGSIFPNVIAADEGLQIDLI